MPKYTYTGEDKNGESISETVEAESRFSVYEVARSRGHVVKVVEQTKRFSLNNLFNMDKINYWLSRVKDDDLVMMTRNIGSMLVAGLPLSRALSVIERQSTNLRVKGTMKDIREKINTGQQFHESLADFPETFNDLYVAMVKAGEESGGLADTLQVLSVQMERASSLKKKIKGAMMYPMIVIGIMVIIGFLMMIYVMPTLIGVFESMDVDLPATTQFIILIANFVNNYTLVAIGVILGVLLSIVYFFRTRIGKIMFSWTVVRLPVIGNIAKEANSARTSRTLSSLLTSGVDVLRAISITEEVVQNHFYKQVIREAAVRVEKGSPLSEVFIENTHLYPVLVGEMISVGEETGKISNMLEELAVFYETEVEHKTKDLSTIIEPLLMVVIGGGVGFFALAMIAPIYSLTDAI